MRCLVCFDTTIYAYNIELTTVIFLLPSNIFENVSLYLSIAIGWMMLLILTVPSEPASAEATVDLEEAQIYRAGLMFQETSAKVQLFAETRVIKIPFSMEPLKETVEEGNQWNRQMIRRLNMLGDEFREAESSYAHLKGKTVVMRWHRDIVNRSLQTVHDVLDFNNQEHIRATQRALASTVGIRDKKTQWYDEQKATVAFSTSRQNYGPSAREKREEQEGDSPSSQKPKCDGSQCQYSEKSATDGDKPQILNRTERGITEVIGSLATMIPYSQLWPLVSDEPVIDTIHSWIAGLGDLISGQSSKHKQVEMDVRRIFESQKKTLPALEHESISRDPTLGTYITEYVSPGTANPLAGMADIVDVTDFLWSHSTIDRKPTKHNAYSVASDLYWEALTFAKYYKESYGYDPVVDRIVEDYTDLIDGVQEMSINMMRIMTETMETLQLVHIAHKQRMAIPLAYDDLMTDLRKGVSILNSHAHTEAWRRISPNLDAATVASANKQLDHVVPKIFLNKGYPEDGEFVIHMEIPTYEDTLTYDLQRSRVVPFASNGGTLELVIPDTAQIVHKTRGQIYRFDWSRLYDCQRHEDTYYCSTNVIESDSLGRCVQAITDAHRPDQDIMEHCRLLPARREEKILRLSPSAIYYDLDKAPCSMKCDAKETLILSGVGVLYLNPMCVAEIGPYSFVNDRGNTYRSRQMMVKIQRDVVFEKVNVWDARNSINRFVAMMPWSWWELGLMVQAVALANIMIYAIVYYCATRPRSRKVMNDPERDGRSAPAPTNNVMRVELNTTQSQANTAPMAEASRRPAALSPVLARKRSGQRSGSRGSIKKRASPQKMPGPPPQYSEHHL